VGLRATMRRCDEDVAVHVSDGGSSTFWIGDWGQNCRAPTSRITWVSANASQPRARVPAVGV